MSSVAGRIGPAEGGCFCGAIRYRIDGKPRYRSNCHCTVCRGTTGAPYVSWFTVDPKAFALVTGEPREYASSEKGRRGFCARCGTQIWFSHADRPDDLDVTTASLANADGFEPRSHSYAADRAPWTRLCDDLRVYERALGDEGG